MKSFILLSLLAHGLLLAAWPAEESAQPHTGRDKPLVLSLKPRHNPGAARHIAAAQQAPRHPSSPRTAPPPRQPRETTRQSSAPAPDDDAVKDVVAMAQQTGSDLSRQNNATQPPAPSLENDARNISPHRPVAATRNMHQDIDAPDMAALQDRTQDALRSALLPYFHYPRLAQRRGWQGIVELGIHIDADGRLDRIWIKRSSGHRILDRAAEKSLHKITALPGVTLLPGNTMELVLPVEFRLVDS